MSKRKTIRAGKYEFKFIVRRRLITEVPCKFCSYYSRQRCKTYPHPQQEPGKQDLDFKNFCADLDDSRSLTTLIPIPGTLEENYEKEEN